MQRFLQPITPTVLALVACVGFVACKPKPPTPVLRKPDGTIVEKPKAPTEDEERAAKQLLAEAADKEASGDAGGAESLREQLLTLHPGSYAAADLYVQRAKQARERGDFKEAVANYESLLFYRPSHPQANDARQHYANLLIEVGRHEDATAMLRALFDNTQESETRVQLGLRLAQALSGINKQEDALAMLVSVHNSPTANEAVKRDIQQRSLTIIDSKLSFKEAERLWHGPAQKPGWEFLQPVLAFKLAKIYYHVRAFEHAEQMLHLVSTRFADSSYAATARDILTRLKARFVVRPQSVGVILPLSGRFQQYGERSLQAIQLAFRNTPVRLSVRDSAGIAAQAAQAVEDLVLQEQVIAIIGPLFSQEAAAAALKAEELSVPLLSLSHREGLPELGAFVFRTALTVQAQAESLARVAFEQLGMSRFVILHPRSRYGIDFAHAFWDEVDKRKGHIRGIESYDHDETTFTTPIRKLVGRYYVWARYTYRNKVAELRAKNLPSHRLRTELDNVQKHLPPVIDFDAIIIPDSARNLGLIAPTLAFEDIVMERDPKQLERIRKATGREDIQPTTLMGASTWNTPTLVTSCERYCEGSIFVDAYFPDSPEASVRDFVAAFREASGAEPYLSEAQAFDAAGLLKKIILEQQPAKREQLRDALLALGNYEGITGSMRFSESGEARKVLQVLTVEEGAIRQWEPPVTPPEG